MHGTVAMPSTAEIRSVLWPIKNAFHKWSAYCIVGVLPSTSEIFNVFAVSAFESWTCTVHWSMPSAKYPVSLVGLPSKLKYSVYLQPVPSTTEVCNVRLSMPSTSEKYAVYFGHCLPQLKYALYIGQCRPWLKCAVYLCQYLPYLKSMQCTLVSAFCN